MVPFLGIIMLFSCKKNDIALVHDLTRTDSIPMQTIWNLETLYTDSSRKKLMVIAPLVQMYTGDETREIYFPEGLKVYFYNRRGDVDSWLSAKKAVYYEEKTLWEASDSVVAVNNKGEILNTELLFWNEREERIYSPKFVKITTPDEVIFGEGFESDQEFSSWNINQVRGTIYHQSEK